MFVLVDLGRRDLSRAIAPLVSDAAMARAVGVVALILHVSGRRFPRQLLEEGHAARRLVLVSH
jgi:hypothetical protein